MPGTACCPQGLLPCSHCLLAFSLEVKAPDSNKTEDVVKHLLLVRSPALPHPHSCPLHWSGVSLGAPSWWELLTSCSIWLVSAELQPPPPDSFSFGLTVVVALQQTDPSKMFPELKENLMDNLKRLRSTMPRTDWKVSVCPCHPVPPALRPGALWGGTGGIPTRRNKVWL